MPEPASDDLVSVIVPSYKHEAFVERALDSVFDQSYRRIELIVLDDRSPDATFERIEAWSERREVRDRFERVVASQNPENLGAHASINRGLSLARGRWLTILNSDDEYAPTRIERLVEAAVRCRAELLFTGVKVVDSEGRRYLEPGLASELEAMPDYAESQLSLSAALLRKNVAVSTGNLFVSRRLFESVGPFRALRYCHDWDFVLRACLKSEPVMIRDPLYSYRIHGTNSFASLKLEQILEPQMIYLRYFREVASGNASNASAVAPSNWLRLFDELVAGGSNVSYGYSLVGGATPKLDRLAKMVTNTLSTIDDGSAP